MVGSDSIAGLDYVGGSDSVLDLDFLAGSDSVVGSETEFPGALVETNGVPFRRIRPLLLSLSRSQPRALSSSFFSSALYILHFKDKLSEFQKSEEIFPSVLITVHRYRDS